MKSNQRTQPLLLTFIFGGAGGGEHENVIGEEQCYDALINSGEGDMHEIPTHIVSEFVFLSLAVNPKR